MDVCELCAEYGDHDCKRCNLGNPCIGCADYDMWNDTCRSEGACGDPSNKWEGTDCEVKDETVVSAILTKLIDEQKKSHHDDEVIGLMEARTEVNNALTLDVKPAKYTTWYVDEELYTAGECQCRSCGAILDDEMIDSNYCPVCGAEVIDPEEEYTRAANETN